MEGEQRVRNRIWPNMPYVPLANPENELDCVFDFCAAWGRPIQLSFEGRHLLVMPLEYYYAHCCTQEERKEIEKALVETAEDREQNTQ